LLFFEKEKLLPLPLRAGREVTTKARQQQQGGGKGKARGASKRE